jgi:O-antigen/teichoic acid export membrane protein
MNKDISLTRRAFLTFVGAVVEQSASFVSGIVFSPVIIRGLGLASYGALSMIRQTVNYLTLANLSPTGVLKVLLATAQHRDDPEEKRRLIGAALITWLCTMPLMLAGGVFLVWATPWLIRVGPDQVRTMRLAMALSVAALALDGCLALSSDVLRGVNLAYRGMGFRALNQLVTGGLGALAVLAGGNVPGVVLSGLLGGVLSGAFHLNLAKRVLPWFGLSKPARTDVMRFVNLGGWIVFQSLAAILLLASDVLFIGIVSGPEAAGIYATTGLALRMVSAPVLQMLSSVNPGLVGLVGSEQFDRVEQVRRRIQVIGMGGMCVVGVGIVLLNERFLELWVGTGYYGGDLLNALLVLLGVQYTMIRIDGVIVEGMLALKEKGVVTLLSGATSIGLGLPIASSLGPSGWVVGMLAGRSILFVYLVWRISARSHHSMKSYGLGLLRMVAVGLSVLAIAFAIGRRVQLEGLTIAGLVVVGGGSTLVACILVWFAGFNRNDRRYLVAMLPESISMRLGTALKSQAEISSEKSE